MKHGNIAEAVQDMISELEHAIELIEDGDYHGAADQLETQCIPQSWGMQLRGEFND